MNTRNLTNQIRIDLSAIQYNFKCLSSFEAGIIPVPVIKSDAYGHDSCQVANTLCEAGAKIVAVFSIDEAVALRSGGYSEKIWLLEGILPFETEIKKLHQIQATAGIFCIDQLMALESYAQKHETRFHVHLKIDTGMSRLGFFPKDIRRLVEFMRIECPHIALDGAYSHIATADLPEAPCTQEQVTEFRKAISQLPESCREFHLCATEAFLNHLAPELPFARPGIGIYGYCAPESSRLTLRPAMHFVSHVISVKEVPKGAHVSYGGTFTLEKDTRLAVVGAGYADGYSRSLSNKAHVLIHGQRVPIRGRICMGMFMVDISDVPDVIIGDEVILLGQQGDKFISAEELASLAGTIPYELLCNLGKCPNRIFIH